MLILAASLLASPQGLHRDLTRLGHVCDVATPFCETASIAQFSGPYDAIVLQANDNAAEAIAVLREIRGRGLRVPVVILASRLRVEEEQAAFNHGADDVLTMPVSTQLLVVRLQAIQRRVLGHASAVLNCGNVTLDQAQRHVMVDGRHVRLTAREFEVLETLMLRPGMLLTKEQFMSRAYGLNEGPNVRVLDVFVCKLRRKLAAAGAAEIVRTVWGSGYVLREPAEADVAQARQRFFAGQPRQRRAHLLPEAFAAAVA
ncbi:response regulator transcription factor [Teichococcus aestuarii]|uniref:DNA-binding response regulator n=1 Tax=Teichococcus aestuarii TaxID=568898 RepID=A0A2U1V2Y6_9PROT|nr:response regulator transcription factor [Pseudoroseomonas aestuarii]PWC28256.1 DNA-binding response regulator [Pseudoroseomonas aestuarii]